MYLLKNADKEEIGSFFTSEGKFYIAAKNNKFPITHTELTELHLLGYVLKHFQPKVKYHVHSEIEMIAFNNAITFRKNRQVLIFPNLKNTTIAQLGRFLIEESNGQR